MLSFDQGRYEVVEEIGAGGMGQVFLVRVVATGTRAALKVLAPRLAEDPKQLERFRREATVMGALEHPHLTRCIDFGVDDSGAAFLVMELLDGRSLHRIVREDGALDGPRAARLGAQIASALHVAHEHGIIHRDVKPSNVVVIRGYDGKEVAKLVDFGVASVKESAQYQRLTRTGQLVGTPNYMAPEQLQTGVVDARTDVYGLGALLYSVLSGRSPYPGSTLAQVVTPILAGDHPPLRVLRPDVGPLGMVVARAMALNPADRFSSARELATALERFASETDAPHAPVDLAERANITPVVGEAENATAHTPYVHASPTTTHRTERAMWMALATTTALAGVAIAWWVWPSGEATPVTMVTRTPTATPTPTTPVPVGNGGGTDSRLTQAVGEELDAAEREEARDAGRRAAPGHTRPVPARDRTGSPPEGPSSGTNPVGGPRYHIQLNTSDGTTRLVWQTLGLNEAAFLRCWAEGGLPSGSWQVTLRAQIDIGSAQVDEMSIAGNPSQAQQLCFERLLHLQPGPAERYSGSFIVTVER